MSGSKNPLRTKAKWILDTHVYSLAAENDRDDILGEGNQLFSVILERCPQVYFSKRQMKELYPHLRRLGYRIPQQMFQSLLALDDASKFCQCNKSPKPVRDEEATLFEGREHDDISDDIHLYEFARCVGAEVLVTEDPNQLKHPNRRKIEKSFGVSLYRIDELLGMAEEES